MAKNTTSIRLPDAVVEALDRRAQARGITRSELILQSIVRALEEDSSWSPEFLAAIGTPRPELIDATAAMMSVIVAARSRNEPPKL